MLRLQKVIILATPTAAFNNHKSSASGAGRQNACTGVCCISHQRHASLHHHHQTSIQQRSSLRSTSTSRIGPEPKLQTANDQQLSFEVKQQRLRFAEGGTASDAARQPRTHVLRCTFAVKKFLKSAAAARLVEVWQLTSAAAS